MKVLMLGWEFPPFNAGGLGTACHGLTKGLVNNGVDVTFVLPKGPKGLSSKSHVNLLVAGNMKLKDNVVVHRVPSLLSGYLTPSQYKEEYARYKMIYSQEGDAADDQVYGEDLFSEVLRYADKVSQIAMLHDHDVIHAHDWMTYQAGIEAKKISGKPLVVHIHATEFDRTGGNPNEYIYDIEKLGMQEADHVFAVSNYTKNMVVKHYGIDPSKITVVHNAVEFTDYDESSKLKDDDKVVLFLGRVTIQKGPDWFLWTAKKVLEYEPNAKFVVAGNGDMMPFLIEKAAELGIHDRFLFTGFLRGKDIDKAYRMANVYVMPSISEPFGITPLEAMRNGTPVIISKQSGVSEVVENAFKVDFWDVDEMANKIISVIRHAPLEEEMGKNAAKEVLKFNWDDPARKCKHVYESILESGFRNSIISSEMAKLG